MSYTFDTINLQLNMAPKRHRSGKKLSFCATIQKINFNQVPVVVEPFEPSVQESAVLLFIRKKKYCSCAQG
jgi:hypothetical protein